MRELDAGPYWLGEIATTRYQRELAYRFKAAHGELKYSKANRIIASDWCRMTMKEENVRAVDIVRHLALAVELCLTPTRDTVIAAQYAASREVRRRRAAVDLPK